MKRSDKISKACSPVELANLLRQLADSLEQGRIRLDHVDAAWGEVEKIVLDVKNKAGVAEIKGKISSRSGAVDDHLPQQEGPRSAGQPSRPRRSYGALKKRMKKTFKNIIYALHEHAWPDEQDVQAFVRDSSQMVRYPGKGDEFYAVYSEAVADFQAAIQMRDMDMATQKAHLLNDLKTRCHKLYD